MRPHKFEVFEVMPSKGTMMEGKYLPEKDCSPIEVYGSSRSTHKRLADAIDYVWLEYPTALVQIKGRPESRHAFTHMGKALACVNRASVFGLFNNLMNMEMGKPEYTSIIDDNKFTIELRRPMDGASHRDPVSLSETIGHEELYRALIRACEFVGCTDRTPKRTVGAICLLYDGEVVASIPLQGGRIRFFMQTDDWIKNHCFGYYSLREALSDLEWLVRPKSLRGKEGDGKMLTQEVQLSWHEGAPSDFKQEIAAVFGKPLVRWVSITLWEREIKISLRQWVDEPEKWLAEIADTDDLQRSMHDMDPRE